MARQGAAPLAQAIVLACAVILTPGNISWAINADGLPTWQGQALQAEQSGRPKAQDARPASEGNERAPETPPALGDRQATPNREGVGDNISQQGHAQTPTAAPTPTDVIQAEAAQSQANSAFVVMWFTIALTVATIAQGVFTGVQLVFNRTAAYAAKTSADLAKSTLVLTQRASIQCGIKIIQPVYKDWGEPIRLYLVPEWINKGPTMAKSLEASTGILTSKTEIDEVPIYQEAPHPDRSADLGHGSIIDGRRQVINSDQLKELHNRELFVYIVAKAAYNDVFDSSIEHTTLIARRVLPDPTNQVAFITEAAWGVDLST